MKKAILVALSCLVVAGLRGQDPTRHGTVERIQVHGKALEGNLEGDSPDRKVAVYLPPSYRSATNRRYPVLYLLHGFTDEVDKWWGVKPHFVSVPVVADRALQAGVSEMILVMPDAFTRYQGSMYSNSVTTGDWENYVAQELVAYIDAHYRTIAHPAGRGLAGHSMGGYGALRIGMKHPGIFSSLYLMSPCCLAVNGIRPNPRAETIHDPAEVANVDFFTKAVFASAAAWSPNPKNPPFFFDLPFKNGEIQQQIVAKWEANAPLVMIDQYISQMRQYDSIAMDVGNKDQLIGGLETLDKVLNDYGIHHGYETYEGDHINHIAERLEKKVLPFFAAHLQPPR
jgi:S-formylglutathione hydrolase FrmB